MVMMKIRGSRIAWWTTDSRDTRKSPPSADAVAAKVIARGGGVLLMHDFQKSKDHEEFVIELTNRLVAAARAGSFRLETLGTLLSKGIG